MQRKGIDQWDAVYPNEEVVERDVNYGSQYILEDGERCLAAVTLNEEQDPAYRNVQWSGGEPVLVIHRLCVDPAYQGTGLGKRLMDFSEGWAIRNAYASIRLDAYTGNPSAVKLYEHRGYRKAGQVYFPRRTRPFFCFEKILVE